MHRVWLIARREYLERIRTRGFIITTIMIPCIMGLFVFGSIFLASKSNTERRIDVVSSDVQLALDLQTELQRQQQEQNQETVANTPVEPGTATQSQLKKPLHIAVEAIEPGPATRARLNDELESGDIDGYLWITPAATPNSRPKFEFSPKSASDRVLKGALATALANVLLREQLTHRGIVASDTDALLQPITLVPVQRTHHNDVESAQVSVMVLFFIMYLVIMLYGMNVARSIIEEKTSRIFEVLLASVRPEAMMAGKILGVGSVGLTQVGIWVAGVLLLAGTSTAMHLGGDTIHVSLSFAQVFFFFLYFVLGYLFYSSIAAALGAMTNSEQELQQLNMFLMLPLLVCFGMLGTLLTSPDSTLARIMALFPPFTPLLMYMRISLGHPHAWEVVLSVVLTSASIGGLVWVTSRIYRVGVLMYGKRPNLTELMHWLKYS